MEALRGDEKSEDQKLQEEDAEMFEVCMRACVRARARVCVGMQVGHTTKFTPQHHTHNTHKHSHLYAKTKIDIWSSPLDRSLSLSRMHTLIHVHTHTRFHLSLK